MGDPPRPASGKHEAAHGAMVPGFSEGIVGAVSLVGKTLSGRYRVVRPLARGALARVYLAFDPFGTPYALKLFPPKARPRRDRELWVGRRLAHPNLNPVLEALDLEEGPALLLAYAPGEELGRWMGKSPAFSQAMRVFHQLLLALAHMHEKGLVHRDVKPENILVNAGEARLLDFDLSGPAQERFQKPLLLGTPAYLAPELLRGLPSGPEADVYAAGIILYWMLTGEHPFADPSGRVSLDPDRGPHPPVAGLGEEAALYLERLLAPDPKARFPTAQEALKAFPF